MPSLYELLSGIFSIVLANNLVPSGMNCHKAGQIVYTLKQNNQNLILFESLLCNLSLTKWTLIQIFTFHLIQMNLYRQSILFKTINFGQLKIISSAHKLIIIS